MVGSISSQILRMLDQLRKEVTNMIDSTNPRSMADNIRHLVEASGSQASDISVLQTKVAALEALALKLTTLSSEKFDTGKKWIDGRIIYGIFMTPTEPITVSYGGWYDTEIESTWDQIVLCRGYGSQAGYYDLMGTVQSGTIRLQTARNGASSIIVKIYFEFVEPVSAALTSPAPDDTRSIEPETREEDPEAEPITDEPIEEPVVEVKKTTRKKTTTTE